MNTYENTTIRGQFDHYSVFQFSYHNGKLGHQIKVHLKNCEDLQTHIIYPEITFNLTKSFKSFGVINDHPTLEVTCRKKNDINADNYGFEFPTNVTISNSYQKFTDSLDQNIALIKNI